MKWYDVLIQEPYFSYINSDPDFKADAEDVDSIFSRYFRIVDGIWLGNLVRHLLEKTMPVSEVTSNEDEIKGYLCFVQSDDEDSRIFEIVKSIRELNNPGWYQIDTEILSPEQIAFLIIYPFASRMGGSFEVEFAMRGDLKKYINELKKKVSE